MTGDNYLSFTRRTLQGFSQRSTCAWMKRSFWFFNPDQCGGEISVALEKRSQHSQRP